ncbi:MAG: peptidase M61, partial [Novosphingobium sp.]
PFPSLARNADYYTEGALIWLEFDQIIRRETGGKRSIDDFAKLFFGMNDGDYGQLAYEVDEIITKLNAVAPYDWAGLIEQRINTPGQPAPVTGIELGGYRLAWRDEPNPFEKARMADAKQLTLTFSIGLNLDKDGKVLSTQWDSPAFNAGIVPGSKIVAINGNAYDADGMKAAISAAKDGAPLELLIQRGGRYQTAALDYRGGLRWPWLERAAPGAAPTGLDRLLMPRRPMGKAK